MIVKNKAASYSSASQVSLIFILFICYIKTLHYVIYRVIVHICFICCVQHTPCRFALVVTDQNKITGVVVVVVAKTGETPQLTGTGTGSPNKNVAVACCNSSATATFFWDSLFMTHKG